jgi:hypothetical protein
VDGLRIGRSLRDASYEGATLTCQSDISYQRSKRDGGKATRIFCLPDHVTPDHVSGSWNCDSDAVFFVALEPGAMNRIVSTDEWSLMGGDPPCRRRDQNLKSSDITHDAVNGDGVDVIAYWQLACDRHVTSPPRMVSAPSWLRRKSS